MPLTDGHREHRPVRHSRDGPRLVSARPWVWVVLVAVLFSAAQLTAAPGRFYPDSTQYLAQTLDLLGVGRAAGREQTVQAFCDGYRRPRLAAHLLTGGSPQADRAADDCLRTLHADNRLATGSRYGPGITVRGAAILSPRYERIFLSRPGVAVFYAPGVALLGPRMGMWFTTLIWTLAGSVLVFLLLRVVGVTVPLAVAGQVLYLILPQRHWTMAPLAEGMTLTLVTLGLLGVAYTMTRRTRPGVVLMVAAFGGGLVVKYSQFLLFAAALAGTAALALVAARRAGRPARPLLVVIAVCTAAAIVLWAVPAALGWPGGAESMQDLATEHFRRPDVPDPALYWLRANARFWILWVADQLRSPLMIITWAVAAWGVVRSRTVVGFAIFAALLAGFGNQAGHPTASQGDRLILLAWLLTVYGLPLLPAAGQRPGTAPPAARPRTGAAPDAAHMRQRTG
ncbi:hypothetical protein [Krasilnikovia sp. MM14-A1004]|uniref:hypothetical protein n=1 Tax=Krasilnikovia sp. MM14-A1004 TaxID=3373541 RepID=UPI00399CDEA3